MTETEAKKTHRFILMSGRHKANDGTLYNVKDADLVIVESHLALDEIFLE